MTRTKRSYRGLKVVESNGRLRKPKNAESLTRRSSHRRVMHRKELFSAELLPFPSGSCDHLVPIIGRNAAALLPLLDTPMTLTDGIRHLRDGVPQLEKLVEGGHGSDYVGDYLSRQSVAINPVTIQRVKGTIRPHMGRGTTPSSVKKAIAERLRAARIAHGSYPTQAPFAKALNIEVERYKKWESGRTPIPPEFIGPICDLLGQDANYLFDVRPKALRKVG